MRKFKHIILEPLEECCGNELQDDDIDGQDIIDELHTVIDISDIIPFELR